MRSGINKLYRHIDTLQRSIPQQISQSQRGTSIPRSGKTGDGVVICCVNATGETLLPYMCVKVENGADVKDPPTIVFPEIDDDSELALYGSVLNAPGDGEDAFVQISGKMIFRIAGGSETIIVGEMLYPLENEVGTKGRVGNIASGLDDLIEGGPLGRSLTLEDSTTELVEVVPTTNVTNSQLVLLISTVHQNYLDCIYLTRHFNVALPALIRRDSTEGGSVAAGGTVGTRDTDTITYTGTQTRTVSKVGAAWTPELQTIGPTTYQAGDSIIAIPCEQEVNDDSSGKVSCSYIALDGRAWGPVPAAD
jgi:hypothetical protein